MLSFNELMNQFRQWDNRSSQMLSKTFSILLFESILIVIFLLFINNITDLIVIKAQATTLNIMEQLLFSQTGLITLIVLLLLLNSFFMLYLLSHMLKIRGILKNIDYNTSRRRNDNREEE